MYKYNMGGTVPRETTIGGQRHNLAYINPFEEDLLNTQYRGGEGQSVPPFAGPGGIPAYRTLGMSPGQAGAMGQGYRGGDKAGSPSGASGGGQRDEIDKQRTRDAEAAAVAARQRLAAFKRDAPTDPYTDVAAFVTTPKVVTPKVVTPKAVASSAGGSATGPSAEEIKAAKILREAKKITGLESLANFFTQGSGPDNEGSDFMRYNEAGELVYEIGHPTGKAGELVDPTLKNSFGFKVGMANSNANDATPGQFNQGIGSGIKTDLDMAFAAGFGTPEEQRAKLILAGYSEADADAYVAKTEATREAGFPGPVDDGNDNPAATVSGIDPFAFTGGGGTPGKAAADPCPEGFIMDPATNACVPMDDTNSGYLGLPSYVTPNPSVPLTDFSQPAVLGQPNLQPYAPINSGTGGNFIQGTNQNNFNRGGPVGGIMDLLR